MIPRLLTLVLGCASLLVLTACPHDDDTPQQPVGFHPVTKNRPVVADNAPVDEPTDPTPPPRQRPQTTQVPESAPVPRESSGPADYPYGVPVKDKPGFVTSPYAPDSGYVDVHGYTPGQEVRDPYTQKIFLVP